MRKGLSFHGARLSVVAQLAARRATLLALHRDREWTPHVTRRLCSGLDSDVARRHLVDVLFGLDACVGQDGAEVPQRMRLDLAHALLGKAPQINTDVTQGRWLLRSE